mgnify:CR=1 FL=1
MIIRQAGGARAPKRAAWERVLECWRRSGLRATEFGRHHGIKTKLLFKWRAKLRQPATPPVAGSFAELEVSPGCPLIEVRLGLAQILLPFDGNAQRLSMILQAVREAAC